MSLTLLTLALASKSLHSQAAPRNPDANTAKAEAAINHAPLSFEQNQGQIDSQVQFSAHGHGYTLYLTNTSAVLALTHWQAAKTPAPSDAINKHPAQRGGQLQTSTLRMTLPGAQLNAVSSGEEQLAAHVNYFRGSNPANWHTNIPTYSRVRYKGVYPGVDLVYYGNHQQLEYDFVVAPEADAKPIRLRFEGARKLAIDKGGNLQPLALRNRG